MPRIRIMIFFTMVLAVSAYPDYIRSGIIETVRDNTHITVIFESEAEKDSYLMLSSNRIIGRIDSLKKLAGIYGKKRYLCTYSLVNEDFRYLVRPGLDIVLSAQDKEIDKRLQKNPFINTTEYKPVIVTSADGREMVLIPSGKFLAGCSICDEDEYPEHVEFAGDYYIDRFEVSNRDYKKYADIKGLPYPDYWESELDRGQNFTSEYFASLPVIVTYHEGEAYALWAGKRLPSEMEWEKAARPPLSLDTPGKGARYSWGTGFRTGLTNTDEFWGSEKTGENIRKMVSEKYGDAFPVKGYLPVEIYDVNALSFYGVANLDGNASEWTMSWYRPYSGNSRKNSRYGSQYKVVRGGAYYLTEKDSRVTDRKTGGIPDLYRDRIAGFRCVMDVSEGHKK